MKPYYQHAGITIYHGVDFFVRLMVDCIHETRAKERLQAIS